MTEPKQPPTPDPSATVRRTELLTPEAAEALAGVLDIEPPDPDGGLPPLWHWVYLLERRRQSELGPDGHPLTGVPAPPGPGRLRMFAGGRVTAYGTLRFGATATRTTRVVRSVEKQGRSGALTFVTARSEIEQDRTLVVADEQDIVYRAAGSTVPPAAPTPPTDQGEHHGDGRAHLALDVDPVLLFRFSALTYNAHRIHYDRDYAQREGYPDLVVHGPLQALLMGELLRRSGTPLVNRTFSYRLTAPTYGAQRLTVTGRGHPETNRELVEARVRDGAGQLTATSTLRPNE
jgi:3-methylfumaryl-CoA hydratase